MNIHLSVEEIPDDMVDGEYAIDNLEIFLGKGLSYRTQRILLVHAIVENYCKSWPHDKVEELTDLLWEGLDMLDTLGNNLST